MVLEKSVSRFLPGDTFPFIPLVIPGICFSWIIRAKIEGEIFMIRESAPSGMFRCYFAKIAIFRFSSRPEFVFDGLYGESWRKVNIYTFVFVELRE